MAKGIEGGPRGKKFDTATERASLAALREERIAAGASPELYEQMQETLDGYDLIADEEERRVLMDAFQKERAAFLADPIATEPEVPVAAENPAPADADNTPEEESPAKRAADEAKAERVRVERRKVNGQVLAFSAELRKRGIDPKADVPDAWKQLSAANRAARRALSDYEKAVRENPKRLKALFSRYEELMAEYEAARAVVESAVQAVLERRRRAESELYAELEAKALAPLGDQVVTFGSLDTTKKERADMAPVLKERMEKELSYDEGGAFLGLEEEVVPEVRTQLSPEEQIALSEKFSKEDAVRTYQAGLVEPAMPATGTSETETTPQTASANRTELEFTPSEVERLKGSMLNSVLTKQAFGGNTNAFRAFEKKHGFPVRDAVRRAALKEKGLSESPVPSVLISARAPFWKNFSWKKPPVWLGGAGIAAALAILAGGPMGKKSEAEFTSGPATAASVMKASSPFAAASRMGGAVIPLSHYGLEREAPNVTQSPAPAQTARAEYGGERVMKAPTVRRHPSLSPDEFKAWHVRFNLWTKNAYPQGYKMEDADKVRKQMVQELGYPTGRVAKKASPEATQAPETANAEKPKAAPPIPEKKVFGTPLEDYGPLDKGR